MPPEAVRYCGRLFSEQEMQLIRALIAEDPPRHRFALSRVVCERLDWRRANGQLEGHELSGGECTATGSSGCRRRAGPTTTTLHRRRTAQAEPELPVVARVDALPALQVRPLADQREAQLWREYVDRYHYLGYTPLPSAAALPGHQPVPGAGGRRLWRQRLEGGSPRRSSAGAWRNARRGCTSGEQRPLLDPAMGAGAQSRFHGAGAQQPTAARRLATATGRCCWRPSCSPTASPVPTAPPTGPTSDKPRAAANSMCIERMRCPQKTSGSTRSGATSAADFALL